MNVFRRTNAPTYSVRFQLAGKDIVKSTGQTEKAKAEKWAKNYAAELRGQTTAAGLAATVQRIVAGGDSLPLADVLAAFDRLPRRRTANEKSAGQRETIWTDFAKFLADRFPAATTLADISPRIAQEYMGHLQTDGRWNRTVVFQYPGKRQASTYETATGPLSPRTYNLYRETLRSIVAGLASRAGITRNPFDDIPRATSDTESRECFTAAELALMWEKPDPFLHPVVLIGLNTGLRLGDICTLRWDEVDLAGGWINRRAGKTQRVVRIPLLARLRTFLEAAPRAGDYVLPDHAAMYTSGTNRDGISGRFTTWLDKLQIATTRTLPGRSRAVSVRGVHSLRHTYAYIAAEAGVPQTIIQSILGHSSPMVTRIYTAHATDQAKAQYLGALGERLPGGAPALPAAVVHDDDRTARMVELVAQLIGPYAARAELLALIRQG